MARRELSEVEWLRRAIRHCEHWGEDCPGGASSKAHYERRKLGLPASLETPWMRARLVYGEEDDTTAPWLPEHLRVISVKELRARLAALESEAA